MKKKVNLKKMFAAFALLVVAVPVSFSVVACKDKSAGLTKKEQALQALKNFPRTGEWTDEQINNWINVWSIYFIELKYEFRTQIFEFTNEQLNDTEDDNKVLKNIIISMLRETIALDLQKWNIPKEFDSDSLVVTYIFFTVTKGNLEINTMGSLTIDLVNPNGNKYPYSGSFSELFRFKIVTENNSDF